MEKNKNERTKYISICIACIILLSGVLYFRINALTNIDINNSVSKISFPKELTNLTLPYEIKATGYETFETEDKDFKITFPNNWDLKNGKSLLNAMSGGASKAGIETVFVVYKISGVSGNISFLVVEETDKTDLKEILSLMGIKVELEEEKDALSEENKDDDVVVGEDIENSNEEEESFTNATIIEKAEDALLLEIISKQKEGTPVHSYIKTITLNNKSYIASLITLEACWESEKEGFVEILNSIEVSK